MTCLKILLTGTVVLGLAACSGSNNMAPAQTQTVPPKDVSVETKESPAPKATTTEGPTDIHPETQPKATLPKEEEIKIGPEKEKPLPSVQASPGTAFKQIVVSAGHACGLLDNGTVRCWGENHQKKSEVPKNLKDVAQVVVTNGESCALLRSGQVKCWQTKDYDHVIIDEVFASLQDVRQLAFARGTESWGCALTKWNEVICAGRGYSTSRLRMPSFSDPSFGTIKSISGGLADICALGYSGKAICWSHEMTPTLSPSHMKKLTQLASGNKFACGIQVDKTVACWKTSSGIYNDQPTVPADLNDVKQISAGGTSACAIKENGEVRCWDVYFKNSVIKVAIPNALHIDVFGDNVCAVVPGGNVQCFSLAGFQRLVSPDDLKTALDLGVYDKHGCFIDVKNTLKCFGDGNSRLGAIPSVINGLSLEKISVARETICTVDQNGRIVCWGDLKFNDVLREVSSVVTSNNSFCAIDGMGAVSCWNNYWSPLTVEKAQRPFPNFKVKQVVLDDHVACALTEAGDLHCATTDTYSKPTTIPAEARDLAQISGSPRNLCAITRNGAAKCWDENAVSLPVPPLGGKAIKIASLKGHACVVLEDQSMQCWGVDPKYPPPAVPNNLAKDIESLQMGLNMVCARFKSGNMRCWGEMLL